MTSLRLRPHRLSRFLMVIKVIGLAALTFFPGTLSANAAGANSQADPLSPPLDLAAIALNPLDLKTRGLQPYGTGDSRYLTLDTAANLIAEVQGKSQADTAEVLNDARFARGYTLTNDNLTAPGDIGSNLNGFVQSTILEFPDTTAATTAYDSFITWPATAGVAIDETEQTLGDASQLVTYTTGGGESPSQQITQLTMRSDNLVAWIIFSAREAPDDAPALTTSLGQILLDKVGLGRTGHAPDLSFRALGIDRIAPVYGRYITIGGNALRLVDESSNDRDSRQVSGLGIVDGYDQRIDLIAGAAQISITTGILTFATETDAETRLAATDRRVQAIPGVSEVVADTHAASLGDGSITLHLSHGERA